MTRGLIIPGAYATVVGDALARDVHERRQRGEAIDYGVLRVLEGCRAAASSEVVPNPSAELLDPRRLWRVAQVADRLGVSHRRVTHLRSTGRLRGIRDRDGRTHLIDPASVEEYERTRKAS